MSREITTHKVNGLNEVLTVSVLDEPGPGGASHEYEIKAWDGDHNVHYAHFQFQKGPIAEAGVNGISAEAMLAIVADRLECFQKGQYACRESAWALSMVQAAMATLYQRTLARVERGVEGTSKV